MFGITAFAQSPYASLGGAFYGLIVNESETLTDTQTVVRDITVSETASTQTLTNTQSVLADFIAAQTTNSQTLTDTQSVLAAFVAEQTDTETLTSLETVSQNFPVTEDGSAVTLSALEDVIAAFVSAQTNSITLTDLQVGGFQYVVSIVEPQTLTDTNVSQVAFLGATSDVLVITSLEAVLAQFNAVCTDLITLSDYQFARGWFKINDNQTVTWVPVNDTQTNGWVLVPDDQNPNWVQIDDNQ